MKDGTDASAAPTGGPGAPLLRDPRGRRGRRRWSGRFGSGNPDAGLLAGVSRPPGPNRRRDARERAGRGRGRPLPRTPARRRWPARPGLVCLRSRVDRRLPCWLPVAELSGAREEVVWAGEFAPGGCCTIRKPVTGSEQFSGCRAAGGVLCIVVRYGGQGRASRAGRPSRVSPSVAMACPTRGSSSRA